MGDHGEMTFSGRKGSLWFGCYGKRATTSPEIPKNSCVRIATGTTMASAVRCAVAGSHSAAESIRALGWSTTAVPNTTSEFLVGMAGYPTNVKVYGLIAVDDFLMLSSCGVPGCAQATTAVGDGAIFAIAKGTNATNTYGEIPAVWLPVRL